MEEIIEIAERVSHAKFEYFERFMYKFIIIYEKLYVQMGLYPQSKQYWENQLVYGKQILCIIGSSPLASRCFIMIENAMNIHKKCVKLYTNMLDKITICVSNANT
jgi:hypothetical protein